MKQYNFPKHPMMLKVIRLGLFLLLSGMALSSVAAEPAMIQPERVALVIGNANYANGMLRNPVNDARAVAAKLESLGFKVLLRENLNREAMYGSIAEFSKQLKEGGVGLFYYAGHGMQIKGRNFLIPVDADIQREDDIEFRGIDANLVLLRMDAARNRVNMLVLDACRNNPFGRINRSANYGLAQMDAPKGTLIAFSTAPGSLAMDGSGANSIYTRNFVEKLSMPAIPVEEVFKEVRIAVAHETHDQQIPWESTSLMGDFYFVPPTQITSNRATSNKPPAKLKQPHEPTVAPQVAIVTPSRSQAPDLQNQVQPTAFSPTFYSVAKTKIDLSNVKKESSADSRKELANRGVPWDRDKFIDAIKSNDIETVGLFLDGKMSIREDEVGRRIAFLFFSDEFLDHKKTFEFMRSKGVDFIADFSTFQMSRGINVPKVRFSPLAAAAFGGNFVSNYDAVDWLLKNSDHSTLKSYGYILNSLVIINYMLCNDHEENFKVAKMLVEAGVVPGNDSENVYEAAYRGYKLGSKACGRYVDLFKHLSSARQQTSEKKVTAEINAQKIAKVNSEIERLNDGLAGGRIGLVQVFRGGVAATQVAPQQVKANDRVWFGESMVIRSSMEGGAFTLPGFEMKASDARKKLNELQQEKKSLTSKQ